jgi:murein DD-endopeptidase MepM/ murein hydrolase activator NlpD
LATGPHLHYEYLTGDVHRNPQTVQLPGAEPLRAQDLQRFRELATPLLADLSPPQPPAAVAAIPTPVTGTTPDAGTIPAAGRAAGPGNASLNPGALPPGGAAEQRSKASVN